ncbi:MAG: adenosylcobinamide-phosphate synthase CbiB [Paracoccaceae bacterium]
MTHALVLAFALILDAIIGDPKPFWSRIPHPAALMGRLIAALDKRFNNAPNQRAKGIATLVILIATALLIAKAITALNAPVIELIIVTILLAHGSLITHVKAVATALKTSLPDARTEVAKIVSRDTADMSASDVTRSVIESAAENFSDGVIAPAFWYLIGGLPGLLIYKFTNTADSMIGYKTPRHADFGWAAARFDDLLNLVPARLTALLISITHLNLKAWPQIRQDAALHKSPNAGWPEAAIAATQHIALAGPRRYNGELRDFPFVNPAGRRDLTATDITTTITALWRTWALALILTIILAVA